MLRSAFAVSVLSALTVFSFSACTQTGKVAPAAPPMPGTSGVALPPSFPPLAPSPRLIVGRVIALDPLRGFAFVELGHDAPEAARVEGAELTTRTLDLRETGRLRASRQLRGRTLGTTILSGQPAAGDEVVWLAP